MEKNTLYRGLCSLRHRATLLPVLGKIKRKSPAASCRAKFARHALPRSPPLHSTAGPWIDCSAGFSRRDKNNIPTCGELETDGISEDAIASGMRGADRNGVASICLSFQYCPSHRWIGRFQ